MRLPRMTIRRWMAVVAVVALCLGWVVWVYRYPGRAFEPIAWKDPNRAEQGVRLSMADRIVAWNSLGGKTREEVLDLLGQPASGGTGGELTYYLGPERGFISIDSEWLSLKFGPDGRVVRSYIWRD
jgi:hypothetical protein